VTGSTDFTGFKPSSGEDASFSTSEEPSKLAKRGIFTLCNSVGKKTMTTHVNNDSLNELNLSKCSNVAQLLKSKAFEDEGLEDMHFYMVAFKGNSRRIVDKVERRRSGEEPP